MNVESLGTNSKLALTNNKLSVEISQDDTEETITNYIKSGIFNFGLDLFFGSVQQNLEVIERLKDAAYKESKLLDFSIPFSIYLKLSPRLQYTGKFKRNKISLNLKLNKLVVLTTNREYASRSCHSLIYVNAKFLMPDVKKCDIIRLGKFIQLQVVETNQISDQVTCKVIVPGIVKPRMLARFPKHIEMAHLKISSEELEDITFAIGTNINVIISHTPGSPEYCNELHGTLSELKCKHFYLFTRLTFSCVESLEDAKWISNGYDGFLIDCSDNFPEDEIIKLSPGARVLMERSYYKRKPIFLLGCWSKFVHPSDYCHAFQLPDKFILPCKTDFLRLFEAVFQKLSKSEILEKDIYKKPHSSSSLLARAVLAASFDFQADAIIVCSSIGEQAIKISHFRPEALILSVTTLDSVVNYTSMYHNILMLAFDMKNDTDLTQKEETHQKLIHGVRYALLKKFVYYSSTVILVFQKHMQFGSADKFAVIKIDNDYGKTINNVILN
ncbi:uncharacterized protein LOC129919266 [Episyrphus balteatus]|uniref:uncharacterized protein LOC129919266 n=1 Tax=Episyrphus balteatus TaxID=286459 RepID=UPI002485CFC5|nr:uncharacterized protein LOC129919266 [Episyrphus balteatus]